MLIQAISSAYYTNMRNYAALSWMNVNSTRLGLLENNINFGSLSGLAALDTQLELDGITASLEYKIANALLEQIKKQQRVEAKQFNTFA